MSEAAMEAVERQRSEALAAVGATFWFDVLRRVGYWEPTADDDDEELLARVGEFGAALESDGERIRVWLGEEGEGTGRAALLTRARLLCLARWWRGTSGGTDATRAALQQVLVGSVEAAPQRQRQRKRQMQEGRWAPASETEAMEAEDTEEAVAPEVAGDVTSWLGNISDVERRAVSEEPSTDDAATRADGLAAAASVMGYAPGDHIELGTARGRYLRRAKALHPDRGGGAGGGDSTEVRTEAFKVLAGAMAWLIAQLDRLGAACHAPTRMQQPKPTEPEVAETGATVEAMDVEAPTLGPELRSIRQIPPALRCWLRRVLLREDAVEVLQTPLTFMAHADLRNAPTVHEAAVAVGSCADWGWGIERVGSNGWASEPWRHDVIVTVEELDPGGLDRLMTKIEATRARGHRVVLVASAPLRRWEGWLATGAKAILHLPAGTVPWGDGAGWADAGGGRGGPATHSWSVASDGAAVEASGCDAARLQRHGAITNSTDVWVLLYGAYTVPGQEAMAELAYTLAGTCCHTQRKFPVWWGDGGNGGRPLRLALQAGVPQCDAGRPGRQCTWQGQRGAAELERVDDDAGPTEEHTRQAREAQGELMSLRVEAEAARRMVPESCQQHCSPFWRASESGGVRWWRQRRQSRRQRVTRCTGQSSRARESRHSSLRRRAYTCRSCSAAQGRRRRRARGAASGREYCSR